MDINVTFRNMEATDALRQHALNKADKLHKFTKNPISLHFILNAEQHKNHIAEIVFLSDHQRYTSTASTNDMYASIDEAIHKLETQLRKHKERIKGHKGE
jgi:putative sigma-54 modulation protein